MEFLDHMNFVLFLRLQVCAQSHTKRFTFNHFTPNPTQYKRKLISPSPV